MTGVVNWWSLVCSRCTVYILPIPLYGLTAVPQALFLITVFSGALLTHSFLAFLLLCPHSYLALTLRHALSRRPVKVSTSVRPAAAEGGGLAQRIRPSCSAPCRASTEAQSSLFLCLCTLRLPLFLPPCLVSTATVPPSAYPLYVVCRDCCCCLQPLAYF